MSFPRYPKYKPSGVEWLREVPAHWDVKRLKYVTTHNDDVLDETTPPETEIIYVDISGVDGVNGITAKEPMIFSAAPSRARRCVRHGDVIVSTVRTYLRAIARIREPEENLIVSTGFAVVRPRALVPNFLGYLLSARFFIEQVIARSTGVSYPAINASELVAIPATVPPLAEQTRIAEFLDRETAKIDGLVAEQRRLMELLKEKRQAVISHAVTRGLNRKAPLKPSGIEWLGDVPQTWTVIKFGRAVFMQEGPGLRNWQFTDEGTRVICVTNITEAGIDFARLEKFISTEEYNSNYRHFTVQRGDVLLSSSGNSWGKVAIYEGEEEVILNTSTVRLNQSNEAPLKRDYIALLLQSDTVREQLALAMTGSCQPNFGPTHINSIMVAIPSRDEQAAIVTFLKTETSQLDTLTAEAQRAIDLLQERRTALISAAVTGQIDVRSAAEESDASPLLAAENPAPFASVRKS